MARGVNSNSSVDNILYGRTDPISPAPVDPVIEEDREITEAPESMQWSISEEYGVYNAITADDIMGPYASEEETLMAIDAESCEFCQAALTNSGPCPHCGSYNS